MYEIGDEFLETVGLTELPQKLRKEVLDVAQAHLEDLLISRMIDDLDESKIAEFQAVAELKEAMIDRYLSDNSFLEDARYRKSYDGYIADGLSDEDARGEAAADYMVMKWMSDNYSGYEEVITECMEQLIEDFKEKGQEVIAELQKSDDE